MDTMQPNITPRSSGGGRWKCFKGITLTLLIIGVTHIVLGFISVGLGVNNCKMMIRREFEDDNLQRIDDVMEKRNDMRRERHHEMFGKDRPHFEKHDFRAGPGFQDSDFSVRTVCGLIVLHCTGIACGIMFMITGALGFGAYRASAAHRKSGLKTGFMVLCILNAILVAPSLITAACVEGIMLMVIDYGHHMVVLRLIQAFEAIGAFSVVILSIVGSAYACCCTPAEEVKAVPVVHMSDAVYPIVQTLSMPVCEKSELVLNDQLDSDNAVI